jgi:hypothetical protein
MRGQKSIIRIKIVSPISKKSVKDMENFSQPALHPRVLQAENNFTNKLREPDMTLRLEWMDGDQEN